MMQASLLTTMPGGFGFLNPVSLPVLERVGREERFGRDHPRKRDDEKPGRSSEHEAQPLGTADKTNEAEPTLPATHIDLRV